MGTNMDPVLLMNTKKHRYISGWKNHRYVCFALDMTLYMAPDYKIILSFITCLLCYSTFNVLVEYKCDA